MPVREIVTIVLFFSASVFAQTQPTYFRVCHGK